jgi:hypothetical protein
LSFRSQRNGSIVFKQQLVNSVANLRRISEKRYSVGINRPETGTTLKDVWIIVGDSVVNNCSRYED